MHLFKLWIFKKASKRLRIVKIETTLNANMQNAICIRGNCIEHSYFIYKYFWTYCIFLPPFKTFCTCHIARNVSITRPGVTQCTWKYSSLPNGLFHFDALKSFLDFDLFTLMEQKTHAIRLASDY